MIRLVPGKVLKIVYVEIDRLRASDMPMRNYDVDEKSEDFRELVESVRRFGIIMPLLVQKCGNEYVVLDGNRRLRAAKRVGLEKVPCAVIVTEGETDTISVAYIANLFRKNPTPLEEAMFFKFLRDKHGLSIRDLASIVGKSVSYVHDRLSIVDNVEPDVGKMLAKSKKAISLVRHVRKVPKELQKRFVKEVMKLPENMQVQVAHRAAQMMTRSKSPVLLPKAAVDIAKKRVEAVREKRRVLIYLPEEIYSFLEEHYKDWGAKNVGQLARTIIIDWVERKRTLYEGGRLSDEEFLKRVKEILEKYPEPEVEYDGEA